MIHEFDVPAIGSNRPDPTRKLVGRPDPAIGGNVAAWSSVTTRPPRRKASMVPTIVAAVLGAGVGFGAALGIGSVVPYTVQNSIPGFMWLMILGVPALFALLAVLGVRSLARADLDPKITIYLGADGMQVNEVGIGGSLRTEIFPFSTHALFRERYVKQPGGWRTRVQLVEKGSHRAHTVSSMVYSGVIDAVRTYHRRANGEHTFALHPLRDGDSDMGQGTPSGKLVSDAHSLSLEQNGSHGAPFASLRCEYDAHTANLTIHFPSQAVTLQLGTITDGPVLLGILAEKGLLQPGAIV